MLCLVHPVFPYVSVSPNKAPDQNRCQHGPLLKPQGSETLTSPQKDLADESSVVIYGTGDPGRSHGDWGLQQARDREIHHAEKVWEWRVYLVGVGRV